MIDLLDLAKWWLTYRILILIPAAMAGFTYGLYVEKSFVPEYTAEAVVQVKSWARQLDQLAARMDAPVLVPVPKDPELQRLNVDDLTREGAIDKLAGNIRALRDTPPADLTAYTDLLRRYGAPEISLAPPAEPFSIIEAPHITKASEPKRWRWYWAAASAAFTLLLGSGVYLVLNEGRVSRGTTTSGVVG